MENNKNLIYTIRKNKEGMSIKEFLLSIDVFPSYAIRLRNLNQVHKNNEVQLSGHP